MSNGNISIETKEDFLTLPNEERQWLMFVSTDKRLKKLEERKNRDSLISAGAGFSGGVAAVLVKMGIFK